MASEAVRRAPRHLVLAGARADGDDAELDRGLPIVSTRHVSGVLSRQGFRSALALPTWRSGVLEKDGARLTVTAMPARHGPPLFSALMPETMGSMLDFETPSGGQFRIWISGDTLVHEGLRDIPRHLGVDLALLHLGGTRVLGVLVSMDGAQGTEAVRLVDPRAVVPIHYDDYTVFRSPLDAFRRHIDAAGLGDRVVTLERGESYRFRPEGRGAAAAGELPHPVLGMSGRATDELGRRT